MSKSRYTEALVQVKAALEHAIPNPVGAFDQVAEMTSRPAAKVLRPFGDIVAEGNEEALSEVADLMLIGAIVAQYGLVVPGYIRPERNEQ